MSGKSPKLRLLDFGLLGQGLNMVVGGLGLTDWGLGFGFWLESQESVAGFQTTKLNSFPQASLWSKLPGYSI